MRFVCPLPFGMGLFRNPDNGHPYIGRKMGGTKVQPHELRYSADRNALHYALLKAELSAIAGLQGADSMKVSDADRLAIQNARMALESEPRERSYAEAVN